MPVAATDVKAYQAANMVEDDVSSVGGAINSNGLVEFTPLAANDTVEMLSDNAGDTTQNVTITGREPSSVLTPEAKTVNGTTVVSFTTTLERINKIVLSAACAGILTVRRSGAGATVVAIPAGKTSVRRLFYDAASEAGAVSRYEKFFFKNEHATDAATNCKINLSADPQAVILVGCAPSVDDAATSTNRKTAPASVVFVDDGVDQNVPGGNLAAGSAIGVWVRQDLGAGAAGFKNTFSVDFKFTA